MRTVTRRTLAQRPVGASPVLIRDGADADAAPDALVLPLGVLDEATRATFADTLRRNPRAALDALATATADALSAADVPATA